MAKRWFGSIPVLAILGGGLALASCTSVDSSDETTVESEVNQDKVTTTATALSWIDLAAPPSALRSAPHVISQAPGAMVIAGIGADGNFWYRGVNPGGMNQSGNTNGWYPWSTWGAPPNLSFKRPSLVKIIASGGVVDPNAAAEPSLAARTSSLVTGFAIATDNTIWYNDNSTAGWQSLGGFNGEPVTRIDAAADQVTNMLYVVASTKTTNYYRMWATASSCGTSTCLAGWGPWIGMPRADNQTSDTATTGLLTFFTFQDPSTGLQNIGVRSGAGGAVTNAIPAANPRAGNVSASIDPRNRYHIVFRNLNGSVAVAVFDRESGKPIESHRNVGGITTYSAPTITNFQVNAQDTLGSEAIVVKGPGGKVYLTFQNPTIPFDETFSLALHNAFVTRCSGGVNTPCDGKVSDQLSAADAPYNRGNSPEEVLDLGIRAFEFDLHAVRSTLSGGGCSDGICGWCPAGQWAIYHTAGEIGPYGDTNCSFAKTTGGTSGDWTQCSGSQCTVPVSILRWHMLHPNHEAITVDFQLMRDLPSLNNRPGIEDGWGDTQYEIDANDRNHNADYFDDTLSVLKPYLFTMQDFMALCGVDNTGALADALQDHRCNWPTLEQLRGKIIVVVHGNGWNYFEHDGPGKRLAFYMGCLDCTGTIFAESGDATQSPTFRQKRQIAWWTDSGPKSVQPYFTGQDVSGNSNAGASQYNLAGWFSHGFGPGTNGGTTAGNRPAQVFRADYETLASFNAMFTNPSSHDWGGTLSNSSGFPYCPDTSYDLAKYPQVPATASARCWADLPGLVENLNPQMTQWQSRPRLGDTYYNPLTIDAKVRTTQTFVGTTIGLGDETCGQCATGGSPDAVYLLNLTTNQKVQLSVTSQTPGFNPVVYIRADAGGNPGGTVGVPGATDFAGAVGCKDTNTATSSLNLNNLPAGTYYVFVDGHGNGSSGSYTLSATISNAVRFNLPLLTTYINGLANLSWSPVSGATSYTVSRGNQSSIYTTAVSAGSSTSFTDAVGASSTTVWTVTPNFADGSIGMPSPEVSQPLLVSHSDGTNGGGTFTYSGSDDYGMAKAACESKYGAGACTSGTCGNFDYVYRTADGPHCNCAVPMYTYEWVYANRGYTGVGQDYGGQMTSVAGINRFVRQKYTANCSTASWLLVQVGYGTSLLSQGAPTSQSSTYGSYVSSRAVDGNIAGNDTGTQLALTNNEAGAWWQVDLGGIVFVNNITVYGQTDAGYTGRTANFNVLTARDGSTTNWDSSILFAGTASPSAGTASNITVNQYTRYLRIQANGTNMLALAEVKVWGQPSGCANGTPTDTWSLDLSPQAYAPRGVMYGCPGNVTWAQRATLCGPSMHVCSSDEFYYRPNGGAPHQNYWTNNFLNYSGSGTGNCQAQTTGGSACSEPMRVCAASSDGDGNGCNWTSCGYNHSSSGGTPNDYFGGACGNTTAGTLCCF